MSATPAYEQSNSLWHSFKQTRDSLAKEQLLTLYLPLVKVIVGRLAIGLPTHVDKDDLTSAGFMGLLDALDKFDYTRGIKFETYATARIRGSILDFLRSQDWVPVSVRQKAKKIELTLGTLEQQLNRPATDEELAAALGIPSNELSGLLSEVNGYSLVSVDEISVVGIVDEKEEGNPGVSAEIAETKQLLAGAIDRLPEKERLVIALYYYEGLTLKEIGVTLSLSEGRISQLHTKAILRLRGALSRKKNLFF